MMLPSPRLDFLPSLRFHSSEGADLMEVALAGKRSIRRRGFEALSGQINTEVDLRPETTDEAFFGRPAKPKASRCKYRFPATATGINQRLLNVLIIQSVEFTIEHVKMRQRFFHSLCPF
jgi:hypothetical protein